MKNNEKFEIWVLITWMIIILGIILSLLSCSPKFHAKSDQIKYESVYTADSAKVNSVPQPKWQFRLKNRRFRDSLNAVLLFGRLDFKRFSDSLKHASKLNEIELKEDAKTDRANTKQSEKTERTQTKQTNKTNRVDSKQDGKTDRVNTKQGEKTERTRTKQTNKTERRKSNWFVWVIVGVLIKPTVKLIYRKARDGLIRWRS